MVQKTSLLCSPAARTYFLKRCTGLGVTWGFLHYVLHITNSFTLSVVTLSPSHRTALECTSYAITESVFLAYVSVYIF